ncbi:unnamed protein product [Spirodela intermedia]|uniref:Methyltransferase type 11 domain-containing protein n=1 Tax=Spirodela intermedia TaxID=51605 RepID=A0A7I8J4T2_SPIIN|nr:unnamed protein product [Spirodela intermedia]CAA6664775.1 unnamed protein product [Spirodela intermedia]
MDSSRGHRLPSLCAPPVFLFILAASNLVTFFVFSSTFSFSSSGCSASSYFTSPLPPEPPPATAPQSPRRWRELLPPPTSRRSPSPSPPRRASLRAQPQLPIRRPHRPVGHPCELFPAELSRFMTYPVNGSCPDDEFEAQRLLLKGCEPLPRRRCRPAAHADFVEPAALPESLWLTPPDSSVVWTAYTCKNYACLIERKNQKDFDDCKDCFDLEEGRRADGSSLRQPLDFSIDEVLRLKPRERSASGWTSAAARDLRGAHEGAQRHGGHDLHEPQRALQQLHRRQRGHPSLLSISQRLPIFDNTLDVVHSMHVISNWIPDTLFHFIFFDIYRVLRPGGIFWLDHFFFVEEQMGKYVSMIDSVGFRRLKWVVGRKLDRGPELKEMYISAVLEKPLKNSW